MGVNKVKYGENVVLDISSDTVTADKLLQGYTAHDNTGALIIGTATGGGTDAISIVDTEDTHGGTIRTITAVDISDTTAVAEDVAQGKYFYTADGTKTEGTSTGGGSSGLEYEEGTWTPSEDVQSIWITFSNTHTVAPFYYMIMDVTATYNSTSNSNGGLVYYNWGQIFGEPLHTSSSTGVRYGVGRKFMPNGSSSGINIGYPYTKNTDSSASYSRYWAKETGIKADSYANGYYWRTGRTYKWIAVWAPTT